MSNRLQTEKPKRLDLEVDRQKETHQDACVLLEVSEYAQMTDCPKKCRQLVVVLVSYCSTTETGKSYPLALLAVEPSGSENLLHFSRQVHLLMMSTSQCRLLSETYYETPSPGFQRLIGPEKVCQMDLM